MEDPELPIITLEAAEVEEDTFIRGRITTIISIIIKTITNHNSRDSTCSRIRLLSQLLLRPPQPRRKRPSRLSQCSSPSSNNNNNILVATPDLRVAVDI